jgi:hypothetical protein
MNKPRLAAAEVTSLKLFHVKIVRAASRGCCNETFLHPVERIPPAAQKQPIRVAAEVMRLTLDVGMSVPRIPAVNGWSLRFYHKTLPASEIIDVRF